MSASLGFETPPRLRHFVEALDALLGPEAELDETRLYRRLPVDARHNAKIDYPRLYRLLDRPASRTLMIREQNAAPCQPP